MKVGFIGTGNMGQAILRGYLKAYPARAAEVCVYNHHIEKAKALETELGVCPCLSLEELTDKGDMILLAVKPYHFDEVLPQVAAAADVSGNKLIVSIAAGITLDYMAGFFQEGTEIVRIMPNTPALVGEAMSSVSVNAHVTEGSRKAVLELFSAVGKAAVVEEKLIDAVIGVSGSSPAYVYMFIEALADGAVAQGMQRGQAYEFAAQAVLGAAKMVLDTGLHPGVLKDQVCSPGGTTIAAVQSLEESGMRAAVIKAVCQAAEKSRDMSNR